ncbi:tyrosine--tRNA ligase [Desulfatiglans anilini]|uniref:tyrosine--tRNA ligase n=1 Tax=Desulfatiglans anilini TaxID=90728 RepID=UPI0003FD9960|nr:tyrosine--tRNA ligase [Desulfatiglans anilini]
MENVLDTLQSRGFVEQVTDVHGVRDLLDRPAVCYIGFDPTAKSLHVGSLLPIMSLVHMQQSGHRPIALVGGGTGMVGDPSGKTEMRPIMSREQIDENAEGLRAQLSRFIDFSNNRALLLNNADWLTELRYINFLRDIGKHFSVNRMLAAESYRMRLETGLSFIEFNYMLLQAYDFWHLFKYYDCRLQMGGNDQWGNILAGEDLIRRLEGETVFGLTFPLLTTSAGIKMGKTHKGAVWLDPDLTSPYYYYQYWINQDDADIPRFLALFTLLPMDEVHRLSQLKGAEINAAKEILAYEATRICHGKQEADRAREAAKSLFGEEETALADSAPQFSVTMKELEQGIPAFILFELCGLCKTRGDARRLIGQGGAYLNGERLDIFDRIVNTADLKENSLLLRAGKKRYMHVVVA